MGNPTPLRRNNGGPAKILDHIPVGGAREVNGADDIARIAAHKDDAGGLHGDIRSCTDRDANICGGERRCIVHAIANHCDTLASPLKTLDG